MFSSLVWDPDRVFFIIPYLNHPVMWYGVLFAFGFVVGYFVVRKLLTLFLTTPSRSEAEAKREALDIVDQGIVLIIIGAVVGARLGHVFFYNWPYYRLHPLDIFKIWEGGLASHGGAIGILAAICIIVWINRSCIPRLTFLVVLDLLVIPTAFAATCIRIGNFMNQEIMGIATAAPWAVTFLHPIDGTAGIPVHPVQLYEALFYFLVFIFLLVFWRCNQRTVGRGLLAGWFFVLVFGFRFVIEYLKVPQNEALDLEGWIRMGQLLSIPFILLGLGLLINAYGRKKG